MKAKSVNFLVAILLFLTIGQVETLRGGLDVDMESEREEQFLTNLISLGISIPRVVAAALFNLINFFWSVIVGWFLFFTSSISATTTTATTTATTIATVPTTSSIMITSTTVAPVPATTATTTATTTRAMLMSTLSTEPNTMTASTPAVTATTTTTTTTSPSTSTATTTSSTSPSTSITTTSVSTSTSTTMTTQPPVKYVFVTRDEYRGDLGGVAGADNICATTAVTANLTGTYLAWISNETVSPSTRFVKSTVPYFRLDGVIFANNYSSLVNDGPLNFLATDEEGILFRAGNVWTNTLSNGTRSSMNDCLEWTDPGRAPGSVGLAGNLTRWTFDTEVVCFEENRLYCFEQ